MYDLRYVNKSKMGIRDVTNPLVKYPGHVNSVAFRLGFDISPNGSILAAGTLIFLTILITAGDDRYVRLWSVNTGQRIHARVSENPFDDTIISLQFSRQENENALWVAGQHLEYWSI